MSEGSEKLLRLPSHNNLLKEGFTLPPMRSGVFWVLYPEREGRPNRLSNQLASCAPSQP